MGYVIHLVIASLRQNWVLCLVVTIIFGTGIFLGALDTNNLPEEQTLALNTYLQSFLAQAPDLHVDQMQIVRGTLVDNILTGLAIYFLGMTVIGLPLVLGFIIFRGFILGFTISFLVNNPDWHEVAVIIFSLLPQNILYIPALLIAGVASLSFSLRLIKRLHNSQISIGPQFIAYTLVMVGCLGVFSLASLAEGYITPYLTRLVASLIG